MCLCVYICVRAKAYTHANAHMHTLAHTRTHMHTNTHKVIQEEWSISCDVIVSVIVRQKVHMGRHVS